MKEKKPRIKQNSSKYIFAFRTLCFFLASKKSHILLRTGVTPPPSPFSHFFHIFLLPPSLRTRELLKQHHERNHTDSPKFACDFCGQRFGRKYHLKRHRAVHTEDGFPCDKCSRIFKREDGLKLHMKAHR